MKKNKGKVFLVGAGPGDPELLTLKAKRLLAQCDVVVYDALVEPKILQWVQRSAEKVDAGKRGFRSSTGAYHPTEQKAINEWLVRFARAGKNVVRLKGGDPFIFGRGGEEAEYLAQHGIVFEVVPGVSSIVAVPAYAGIPITDRRYNSMLTVITGHAALQKKGAHPVEWDKISQKSTLVILMGVENFSKIIAKLLSLGWSRQTPMACISSGTTVRQQTLDGTLGNILRQVQQYPEKFKSPAVVVVGRVVKLRKIIPWFQP